VLRFLQLALIDCFGRHALHACVVAGPKRLIVIDLGADGGAISPAPRGGCPNIAAITVRIGTWDQPAALLGASSVTDGTLVVDPRGQRVWFRPPATAASGSLAGRQTEHPTGSRAEESF
jgi:hypothetical protein